MIGLQRVSPVLVAWDGAFKVSGKSVKNTIKLIGWISTKIAQIVLWIEDGTREIDEIVPLKDAIQAVVDRKQFKIVVTDMSRPRLKKLATSIDSSEVHSAWIQFYRTWGIKYLVPEVPFTASRINTEEVHGRILIYLAPELSSAEALVELGKLFPKMSCWAVSGREDAMQIQNEDLSGWLFVEQALDMPNPNTTTDGLRKIFSEQNAKGMTINIYAVFGQFCKEVFGEYPDISGGYVRLLNSSYTDSFLDAHFAKDGYLSVNRDYSPDGHNSRVGGRSIAV